MIVTQYINYSIVNTHPLPHKKKEKKMQVILLDIFRNQQLDNTPSPTVTNHAWKIIGPHPENVRQSNHLLWLNCEAKLRIVKNLTLRPCFVVRTPSAEKSGSAHASIHTHILLLNLHDVSLGCTIITMTF